MRNLPLREITAPDGYEIAEDVTFTLKDTMEVQKVEMKDARTPEKTTEKTNAPKTGDNQKVWAICPACTGICRNSYRE